MGAPARSMVLIAGAWHGAWCWSRLAPLLRQRGHRVLTPELPATGADSTDPAHVTLESWSRGIAEFVSAQPEPCVLLGHSRGGVVISRVAELVPEKITRLVYLAAYLLPAGGNVAATARQDAGSLIAANMVPAATGITCTLRPDVPHEAFYNDCDADTAAWASAQLRPEPLKPLVTPLKVSDAKFGRVPRAYIRCTRDRTVSLAAQDQMLSVLPCEPVLTLDSGHSPFLSRPDELAVSLDGI